MECFDGAEVCVLVGVYILHFLRTVMREENVGLCHDDGLGQAYNEILQVLKLSKKENK